MCLFVVVFDDLPSLVSCSFCGLFVLEIRVVVFLFPFVVCICILLLFIALVKLLHVLSLMIVVTEINCST